MTGSFGELIHAEPYVEKVPCRCMACGLVLGMESRPGGLLWAFRKHVDSGECPWGGVRS